MFCLQLKLVKGKTFRLHIYYREGQLYYYYMLTETETLSQIFFNLIS